MKKIFVLDTNVPMLDPTCIESFEDNDIVLPSMTIKELNNNKKRYDEKGRNARYFTNILDELSKEHNIYEEGVPLEGGGILTIGTPDKEIIEEIKDVFFEIEPDDFILSTAIRLYRNYINKKESLEEEILKETDESRKQKLQDALDTLKPVIFVSKDNNLRMKAKKFGIPAENYQADQIQDIDDLYSGWTVIPVPSEIMVEYYKQENRNDSTNENEVFIFSNDFTDQLLDEEEFYPNEYIVLVDENDWEGTEEDYEELAKNTKAPVLRYDEEEEGQDIYCCFKGLIKMTMHLKSYNIEPRNLHQRILIDTLFLRKTTQKSVIGLAGSGKTLFSLLASIIMVKDLGLYDEIIITRPTVPTEYEIGFLPGNEEEKMDPYLRGFQGNLKYIVSQKFKDKYRDKKMKSKGKDADADDIITLEDFSIKTKSMSFMRGETTYRQIVIIDESQNTTMHAMKTALTRIGEDSLIIILGDITQIDHHLLDATNNGLSHAVEIMKDDSIASHIRLVKGERSPLSEKIAEKWDKPLQ